MHSLKSPGEGSPNTLFLQAILSFVYIGEVHLLPSPYMTAPEHVHTPSSWAHLYDSKIYNELANVTETASDSFVN